MDAGFEAGDDGVEDAGGAIDDVERRMEVLFDGFACGDFDGVFVGDPAGVDAVHVDTILLVVCGGGTGHHVERGFGHVGVGVAGGFPPAVELAFDGGDVDDVFVAFRGAEQEGFESGVEDEGSDGVDELDFEEFDGGDFGEQEPPGVAAAEIDLLEVLVEASFREEVFLAEELFGEEGELGEFG